MSVTLRQRKREILIAAKLLIFSGLLYVLYLQFPVESFKGQFYRLRPQPILLAAAGYLLIQVAAAIRLALSLAAMELKPPLANVIRLHYASLFFHMFFPGGIGGDAVKGFYLRKASDHWSKGFVAVLLDRYIGFSGLISLGLVSGIMMWTSRTEGLVPLRWTLTALVLWMSVPYLFLFKRVRAYIRWLLERFPWAWPAARLVDETLGAARRPKLLFLGGSLTLLFYLGLTGIHLLLGKSLGVDLNYWVTLYLVVGIALVSAIPLFPGAYGQREAAYVFFFAAYGMTRSQSYLLAMLVLGILLMGAAFGGIVYLFMRGHLPEEMRKGEEKMNFAA